MTTLEIFLTLDSLEEIIGDSIGMLSNRQQL
jgi:hypothetical protein